MRRSAAFAWCALALCCIAQEPPPKAKATSESPKLTAITNVTVVDVGGGSSIPNQTVLIANGKIVMVGNPMNMEVPKHALKISGRGKHLMPGLWDMHVHVAGISAKPEWGKQLLPVYLAYGITGIRDMGGELAVLKDWRRTAASIPGPEMIVAGPFIDASAEGYGSPQEVIAVKTPLEAREAVRKVRADGANFIKIGSRLTRELYFAIADETGKLNMAFVGHVPDSIPVEEASFSGMGSMEHLFGMMISCSSKSADIRQRLAAAKDRAERAKIAEEIEPSFSEAVANELFARFVKYSTFQVPTLVWTRNSSTLEK
ncbi:MAG TPA: hypothetical protein VM009_04215, partial [Terriglobales bacterium]|nr:hypothetical protein [Terriglobales bacterium]